MTRDQKLGLAVLLGLLGVVLLLGAVVLLPITLAAKLAILGGFAMVLAVVVMAP